MYRNDVSEKIAYIMKNTDKKTESGPTSPRWQSRWGAVQNFGPFSRLFFFHILEIHRSDTTFGLRRSVIMGQTKDFPIYGEDELREAFPF